MKINELSNINENIIKRNISYDKYNFNSTIFQMKQNSPLTNDIIINKKSNEFKVSMDKKIGKIPNYIKEILYHFLKKVMEMFLG